MPTTGEPNANRNAILNKRHSDVCDAIRKLESLLCEFRQDPDLLTDDERKALETAIGDGLQKMHKRTAECWSLAIQALRITTGRIEAIGRLKHLAADICEGVE